jgi:hypothetical protein
VLGSIAVWNDGPAVADADVMVAETIRPAATTPRCLANRNGFSSFG